MKRRLFKVIIILAILVLALSSVGVSFAAVNQSDNGKLKISNISSQKIINSSSDFDVNNLVVGDINKSEDNVITMVDKNILDTANDSTKDSIKNRLKGDFDNYKYVVFYGNKDNLKSENDMYKVLDITNGVTTEYYDDTAKETAKRIIAFGITKTANNSIYVDSYYAAPGSDTSNINDNMGFILNGFKHSLKVKDNALNQLSVQDKLKPQDVNTSPDYTKTENFDYGGVGSFQTTQYFDRAVNGANYSIWDVKMSDTTVAGCHGNPVAGWSVDYLYTRSSVQNIPNETVIDHGPSNTQRDQTASVGLDASGPIVGWTFSVSQMLVTDDYQPINNYARWIFDYARWSSSAMYSQKSEPGARFKNTSGQFIVDNSHTITFWDEFWGTSVDKNTGTYRYYFNDR